MKIIHKLLVIMTMDMLGVGIVIPLLNSYALDLGASPSTIGALSSSYGVAQLIGGPFMGALSDRSGRKLPFALSCCGCIVSYWLIGAANSVFVMFLARIPVGLTKQTFNLSAAIIADTSVHRDRSKQLGLLGVAASAGFIVGPMLGGFLSQYGRQVPTNTVALLYLCEFLVILLWLPETNAKVGHHGAADRPAVPVAPGVTSGSIVQTTWTSLATSFTTLLVAFKDPGIGELLLAQGAHGLGFLLWRTSLTTLFKLRFDLTPQHIGAVLSYWGVAGMLSRALILPRVVRRFPEVKVIQWAIVGLASSMVLAALTTWSLYLFLVMLLPIMLFSSLSTTCFPSLMTQVVEPGRVGGLLGVNGSLDSIARALGPLLGGLILSLSEDSGSELLMLVVAAWLFAVALFWVGRASGAVISKLQANDDEIKDKRD